MEYVAIKIFKKSTQSSANSFIHVQSVLQRRLEENSSILNYSSDEDIQVSIKLKQDKYTSNAQALIPHTHPCPPPDNQFSFSPHPSTSSIPKKPSKAKSVKSFGGRFWKWLSTVSSESKYKKLCRSSAFWRLDRTCYKWKGSQFDKIETCYPDILQTPENELEVLPMTPVVEWRWKSSFRQTGSRAREIHTLLANTSSVDTLLHSRLSEEY